MRDWQLHCHLLAVERGAYIQELRGQLHNDSQQQQDLLDQQHDFIQELETQQQQLRVSPVPAFSYATSQPCVCAQVVKHCTSPLLERVTSFHARLLQLQKLYCD